MRLPILMTRGLKAVRLRLGDLTPAEWRALKVEKPPGRPRLARGGQSGTKENFDIREDSYTEDEEQEDGEDMEGDVKTPVRRVPMRAKRKRELEDTKQATGGRSGAKVAEAKRRILRVMPLKNPGRAVKKEYLASNRK
jgi:hypothetical protein